MPDVWGFGDENTARRAAKFFGSPCGCFYEPSSAAATTRCE